MDATNFVVNAKKAIIDTARCDRFREKAGQKESTLECCLVVTLDINNALNSDNWDCVMKTLHEITTVAYADDVAVVIIAKHLEKVNCTFDMTFEKIS